MVAVARPERFAQRLEAKYMPVTESGCWLWIGSRIRHGYGQIFWPYDGLGKIVAAHRAAYALEHGFMPGSEQHVCHKCDTPSCVNPDHLFIGDAKSNLRDMSAKGRGKKRREICGRGHAMRSYGNLGRQYCPICNQDYARKAK